MQPDILRDLNIDTSQEEKVLWVLKPSPFRFFREEYPKVVLAFIVSAVLAVMTSIPSDNPAQRALPITIRVVVALLPLVIALIYSARLIGKARRTTYILTNQRAIISESDLSPQGEVRSYTRESAGKYEVVELRPDYGDIIFDQKKWQNGYFVTKSNPSPDTSRPSSWIGPCDLETSKYDKAPAELWRPIGFLGISDLHKVAAQVKDVIG